MNLLNFWPDCNFFSW